LNDILSDARALSNDGGRDRFCHSAFQSATSTKSRWKNQFIAAMQIKKAKSLGLAQTYFLNDRS